MKWCALCGEPVKDDPQQGWVRWHENGDGLRCYCPTTTGHDWKAAQRREEADADTNTLLGKFNAVLGCLEDAAHWLNEINKEFEKRYPDDMDPKDPAAPFWYAIAEASESRGFRYSLLEQLQSKLQAVEQHISKEVTT